MMIWSDAVLRCSADRGQLPSLADERWGAAACLPSSTIVAMVRRYRFGFGHVGRLFGVVANIDNM